MRNMLTVILCTFFSCLSVNTVPSEPEIVFFLETDEGEVVSDYQYVIHSLKEYYVERNVKIREVKEREFELGAEKVTLRKDQSFAMIILNKEGEVKIDYTFGTDVDLMLVINDFLGIN